LGEVGSNVAFPESFLEEYHIERFIQLNRLNLSHEGRCTVYAWVFMRYGDNPLRKLKIEVAYQINTQSCTMVATPYRRRIIADSGNEGFNPDHYTELAEI